MQSDWYSSKPARLLAWGTLLLAVAGTACVLFNPYLWFDEAGQFFLALGMDHWSKPFTPPRGLSAVFKENNRYLFDPFGYTLLVRLWAGVSTAAAWLRTLPFLGFLGMLTTGYALLRKCGVAPYPALLLTALFPSSPLLHQYAGELRPYSYEAWGALYAAWAWYELRQPVSPRRSLLVGCGMASFLWMRYPLVLPAGITAALLLAHGWRQEKIAQGAWWKQYVAYGAPQAISAVLIYVWCVRYQPITEQAPCYAMASTLKYHPAHLLHPWTAAYASFLLLFFAAWAWGRRSKSAATTPWAGYAGGLVLVFTVFSVLGKLPSDPSSRWAIALTAVMMLCLLLVLAMMLQRVGRRWQPLLFGVLALTALYRPALQTLRWYQRDPVRFPGRSYARELRDFSAHSSQPIVCGSGSTPEVRYLFEWGSLRQDTARCRYPENFVLLNQQNEWAYLNGLPLQKPVIWIDSPGKYVRDGRFATARVPPYRIIYTLWRVR